MSPKIKNGDISKLIFLALLTACGTEETTTTTYTTPAQPIIKLPDIEHFTELGTSKEYCKSGSCFSEFVSPIDCKVTYVVLQIVYQGKLITGARIDIELAKGEKTIVEYAPEFIKQEKTTYSEQSRTIFLCPVD